MEQAGPVWHCQVDKCSEQFPHIFHKSVWGFLSIWELGYEYVLHSYVCIEQITTSSTGHVNAYGVAWFAYINH